ncbi:MAG: peptide-methionine (S)-S-oxide reductase MsrA [Gammaproteobacteria bacterium]|nr:peptide-methionine (S)-S-oxide reductase MsrA [Gammaproteobacteria bacterium]
MLSESTALPGRAENIQIDDFHFVHGRSMVEPFPTGMEKILFGMGCFWGAERKFWSMDGVYTTAVGYTAGFTPNPTYKEVCSGMTGHNEVVLIVYDPSVVSLDTLLTVFWESHDPTQGMRQGNDSGAQYRSGIYFYSDTQCQQTQKSLEKYQARLGQAGYPSITTEIHAAAEFYYAEVYHQQYLGKTPGGYCGLAGTGVSYL